MYWHMQALPLHVTIMEASLVTSVDMGSVIPNADLARE